MKKKSRWKGCKKMIATEMFGEELYLSASYYYAQERAISKKYFKNMRYVTDFNNAAHSPVFNNGTYCYRKSRK